MCDTLIKAKILKTWYLINCPKSPLREDQFIHLSRIKKYFRGASGATITIKVRVVVYHVIVWYQLNSFYYQATILIITWIAESKNILLYTGNKRTFPIFESSERLCLEKRICRGLNWAGCLQNFIARCWSVQRIRRTAYSTITSSGILKNWYVKKHRKESSNEVVLPKLCFFQMMHFTRALEAVKKVIQCLLLFF